MKILVTGHEGFIGSRLLEKIEAENPFPLDIGDVSVVGRDTKSSEPLDYELLEEIEPDIIVNLGATLLGVGCDISWSDEDLCGNVSTYANDFGIPVFHASSIAAAQTLDEVEKFGYAWRKNSQEEAMLAPELYGDGIDHHLTIARFHNVYGPGSKRPSLYAEMLWCHSSEEPLQIFNGEQMRSWVFVDDLCDMIIEWIGFAAGAPGAGMALEEWLGISLSVLDFVHSMEYLHHLECRKAFGHGDPGQMAPTESDDNWKRVLVSRQLR